MTNIHIKSPVVYDFLGLEFSIFPPNVHDGVAGQVGDGSFERPMPAVFSALARADKAGVVFDIGANNGIYSLLACASNANIISHAFEPYPPVISILEQTIAANTFRERITLHKIALSEFDGEALLHIPDSRHGLMETSCSLNADFQPTINAVPVPTRRLDDLGLPSPTLIKLDVEGHEPAVLAGARCTLREARPILFIEVLDRADTSIVNEIAAHDDFHLYRLHQDGFVLREEVVAFDIFSWNHILVPQEKVATFEAVVRAANVPLR